MNLIYKLNLALLVSRLPVMKSTKFARVPILNKVREMQILGQRTNLFRERIRVLLDTYTFFRKDDDIADGEYNPNMSPVERVEYIEARIDALKTESWNIHDDINTLTHRALALAKKLGVERELRECFLYIFESLAFDARRIAQFSEDNKPIFFSQEVLTESYFRMDSLGTGQAFMHIF